MTYYNQTPLDSKSILYTAFLMLRGMFEWVYVTIKLEGIPSYFQRDDRVARPLRIQGKKIYLDLDRRLRLHRSGILGESKIGLPKILGVYITRRGANSGLTL